MKIFICGDSTVKNYENEQFMGGFGQFLPFFTNIPIINCAEGGRSTRSFINEGRLYKIPYNVYPFKENNSKPISENICPNDYLFICFCHNDDESKKEASYRTMFNRLTPLGKANKDGIYPTNKGHLVTTSYLPNEYIKNYFDIKGAFTEISLYGPKYYSYDCGGTYKWYLKEYIKFARKRKVTPILITAVPRIHFKNGKIIGGASFHGENFAYIEAIKQVAQEENVILIDLFTKAKELLETLGENYAKYLMALKPDTLTGKWPDDYDACYNNPKKGCLGIEDTHYNKFGAFLHAAFIVDEIIDKKLDLAIYFNNLPSQVIAAPNHLIKLKLEAINKLYKHIKINL